MLLKLLVTKLNDKMGPCCKNRGLSSVSLLFEDRPEIAELLNGHDALKQWLVDQFSGKVVKFSVQWDTKEPEGGDVAEHNQPRRNDPAKIRVSKKMSGIDQLSGVVFELFNIQYHKRHSRLWKQACDGKIDKQEYSRRTYWLEYKAKGKCKRFFKKHSSVFAVTDASNEIYNMIMSPMSFQEFYAVIKERCGGETYYMKVFEERVTPHLKKSRANERGAG